MGDNPSQVGLRGGGQKATPPPPIKNTSGTSRTTAVPKIPTADSFGAVNQRNTYYTSTQASPAITKDDPVIKEFEKAFPKRNGTNYSSDELTDYKERLRRDGYLYNEAELGRYFLLTGNYEAAFAFAKAALEQKKAQQEGKEVKLDPSIQRQIDAWRLFWASGEEKYARELIRSNISLIDYIVAKNKGNSIPISEELDRAIDSYLRKSKDKVFIHQLYRTAGDIVKLDRYNTDLKEGKPITKEYSLKEYAELIKERDKELSDILLKVADNKTLTKEEEAKYEAWQIFPFDEGFSKLWVDMSMGKKLTDEQLALLDYGLLRNATNRVNRARLTLALQKVNDASPYHPDTKEAQEQYRFFNSFVDKYRKYLEQQLEEAKQIKDEKARKEKMLSIRYKINALEPDFKKRLELDRIAKMEVMEGEDFVKYTMPVHEGDLREIKRSADEKSKSTTSHIALQLEVRQEKLKNGGNVDWMTPTQIQELRDQVSALRTHLSRQITYLEEGTITDPARLKSYVLVEFGGKDQRLVARDHKVDRIFYPSTEIQQPLEEILEGIFDINLTDTKVYNETKNNTKQKVQAFVNSLSQEQKDQIIKQNPKHFNGVITNEKLVEKITEDIMLEGLHYRRSLTEPLFNPYKDTNLLKCNKYDQGAAYRLANELRGKLYALESLDTVIDNLRAKSADEIFAEWEIPEDQAKELLEKAKQNGYDLPEIRKIAAAIKAFNNLPESIKQEITGTPLSIDGHQVLVKMSKGTLKGSRLGFLDSSFSSKIYELKSKENTKLTKVQQELADLLKKKQNVIKDLASKTEKGVSTTASWLPFLCDEDDILEGEQSRLTSEIKDLLKQVKEKQKEFADISSTVRQLNNAWNAQHITELLNQGKVEEADRELLYMLNDRGLNIAPQLIHEVVKHGDQFKDQGTLERLRSKNELESFGTEQILTCKQEDRFGVALRIINPPKFNSQLPVRETDKGKALDFNLALSALDNDPDLAKLQEGAVKIDQTVKMLSKLIQAGNKGTKYDPFIKFMQNEGKALHEFLNGWDSYETVLNVEQKIKQLKEAFRSNKNLTENQKTKIQERIKAMESMTALFKNEDVNNMVNFLRDKSKFKPDTWAAWAKKDGPVVLAAVGLAVLATVTTIASCGTLGPAWVVFLGACAAGTAAGMIGAEVVKEVQHSAYNNAGDGLMWSERSKYGAYRASLPPGEVGFFEQFGRSDFWSKVGGPYAAEFGVGFAFTVATLGIGKGCSRIINVGLTKAFATQAGRRMIASNNPVLSRIVNKLVTIESSQAGSQALKQGLLKRIGVMFLKEFPEELTDEALEAALTIGLSKIDKRLAFVASVLVCTGRGLNVKVNANSSLSYNLDQQQEFIKTLESEDNNVKVMPDGTLLVLSYNGETFALNPEQTSNTVNQGPTIGQFVSKLPQVLRISVVSSNSYQALIRNHPNTQIITDSNLNANASTEVVFENGRKNITIRLSSEVEAMLRSSDPAKQKQGLKILHEEIAHAHQSQVYVSNNFESYQANRIRNEIIARSVAAEKSTEPNSYKDHAATIGRMIRRGQSNQVLQYALDNKLITQTDLAQYNIDYQQNTLNGDQRTVQVSFNTDNNANTTAADARFNQLRNGELGKVRPESTLSVDDLTYVINHQLNAVTEQELQQILSKFPNDKNLALLAMTKLSQFGNLESMNEMYKALAALGDYNFVVEGRATLGDMIRYLQDKGNLPIKGKDSNIEGLPSLNKFNQLNILDIEKNFEPGSKIALVVDDNLLQRLEADDGKLGKHLAALKQKGYDIKLVSPEGWSTGVNALSQGQNIGDTTSKIVARAKEIQQQSGVSETEAVSRALRESIDNRLGRLGLADNIVHIQNSSVNTSNPTTQSVASQLAPRTIDTNTLNELINKIPDTKIPGDSNLTYRDLAREWIAHDLKVFSPRALSLAMKSTNTKISSHATSKGIPKQNIYYLVPQGSKSYGNMTMQYAQENGIPDSQIITDPSQIPDGADKSMIVVLDDMAGSGDSLLEVYYKLRSDGYKGEVVLSPIVATTDSVKMFDMIRSGDKEAMAYVKKEILKTLFGGKMSLAELEQEEWFKQVVSDVNSNNGNLTFMPNEVIKPFIDSEYFNSLTPEQQKAMRAVLGNLGYKGQGLSLVLPTGTPNNNNTQTRNIAARLVHNGRGVKQSTYRGNPGERNPVFDSSQSNPSRSSQPSNTRRTTTGASNQ